MSGPFDPRQSQMPPSPGQPEWDQPEWDQPTSQPAPGWRMVDPARGPSQPAPPDPRSLPGGYPPQPSMPGYPGAASAPGYPGNPGTPSYPGYPSAPGYPGYPAGPSRPTPGPMSVPGPQGQWGYAPPSGQSRPGGQGEPDWSYQWAGWGQGAPAQPALPAFQSPFEAPPQGYPELEPEEPRQPPSPLLIALGVVLALALIAAGGAGLAYTQYRAPASAAAGFCNHLIAQDYGATYADLAASVQAQYAADAFVASARQADMLLGAVTTCNAAADGKGYRFSLGQSSAQVAISLTRAQGGSYGELVTLKPERGGWRLQQLDAGLFGLDVAPLVAANTFCLDLRSQNYAGLYGLLDAHAQAGTKQSDFVSQGALHDQIDGAVSACDVLSVSKASSATTLTVTLGVTRPRNATEQGPVTLTRQGGSWLVDGYAGNLLGSDLRPLAVGAQFCAALVAGDYATAYGLLTEHGKGGESESQFADGVSGGGLVKWIGCTPDYTTYTVSGGKASYTANIQLTSPQLGASASRGLQLAFVLQGNRWLLDEALFAY